MFICIPLYCFFERLTISSLLHCRNQTGRLSDSDSGNGDTTGKRKTSSRGLDIPNNNTKKNSQQRRHSRQNSVKSRSDKNTRNENRAWNKQNKGDRGKKSSPTSKSKPMGEVTDTDSGQEMNSPYDEGMFTRELSFVDLRQAKCLKESLSVCSSSMLF